MVRDHGTDILATGEHELDDHALILDQIVVEVNLAAILGNKFHVGQVTPADELARRDVLEVVLLVLDRLILTEQPGCAGNGGSCSCSRQQISPCHLCRDLCSLSISVGPTVRIASVHRLRQPPYYRPVPPRRLSSCFISHLFRDSCCCRPRGDALGIATSWRGLHAACCGSAWASPPQSPGSGRIG